MLEVSSVVGGLDKGVKLLANVLEEHAALVHVYMFTDPQYCPT